MNLSKYIKYRDQWIKRNLSQKLFIIQMYLLISFITLIDKKNDSIVIQQLQFIYWITKVIKLDQVFQLLIIFGIICHDENYMIYEGNAFKNLFI